MHITSLQNPQVKALHKLGSSKRERDREGLMLVEGYDEISLALAAGHVPRTLLTAPSLTQKRLDEIAAEHITLSEIVFNKLSHRENPDGWLAVFATPKLHLTGLKLNTPPLILVLEAIEKPGNLGAILRTADAAAVDAVLVCDQRADIYSPNVVRASRGALFSVPIVVTSNTDALEYLHKRGVKIVAATPDGDITYTRSDLTGPLALVVGTEDQGLTRFWLDSANIKVQIPMVGKVNSLNVSVAAALLVYEARRQRSG